MTHASLICKWNHIECISWSTRLHIILQHIWKVTEICWNMSSTHDFITLSHNFKISLHDVQEFSMRFFLHNFVSFLDSTYEFNFTQLFFNFTKFVLPLFYFVKRFSCMLIFFHFRICDVYSHHRYFGLVVKLRRSHSLIYRSAYKTSTFTSSTCKFNFDKLF